MAFLRETVRSLRIYFVFVGTVGGIANVVVLLGAAPNPITWLSIIGLGFALTSFYLGVRLKQPDGKDTGAVSAFRKAQSEGFARPNRDEKWPVAYAARRTAWHALDHAWEIEDRLP